MDGAHFGDLEQSFPLRRAQIARDGYLALDAVEARRLAAAAVVAVLRMDLRVREVDLGADVNLRVINDSLNLSPLQLAMRDLRQNPNYSWSRENPNKRRVYALLVANGATIPPDGADADDAYLCKVRAAGGFPAYEMAHRMRLTATCARVVFPRLPVDAVSHVVAFAFHTGYY